ncbi:beta strand repeat-containing protein [Candidatus Omnitrophota bacterium]
MFKLNMRKPCNNFSRLLRLLTAVAVIFWGITPLPASAWKGQVEPVRERLSDSDLAAIWGGCVWNGAVDDPLLPGNKASVAANWSNVGGGCDAGGGLGAGVLAVFDADNGQDTNCDWDYNDAVITGITSQGAYSATVTLSSNVRMSGGFSWATAGVFDASTKTMEVGADFTVSAGTFTKGTSTVKLNGAADQTITSTQAFNNLQFANTGVSDSDDILLGANLNVDGNLTVTNGDFTPGAYTVNLAGDLSIATDGSWDNTSFTGLTFDGTVAKTWTDSSTSSGPQDIGAVTINKTDTVTPGTNNKITLASSAKATSVTIDGTASSEDTLDLGSSGYTLTLTGSGTPLSISGTLTAGANSTLDYIGSTHTNIAAATYNNLGVKPGDDSITHTFATGTIAATGNLTLGNGTNTGVVVTAADNSTILDIGGDVNISANTNLTAHASNGFTVGGSWANSGTFTHSDGTVQLDAAATGKTIDAGGSSFYDLNIIPAVNATYTLADDLVCDNNLLVSHASTGATILDTDSSNDYNITVTGNLDLGVAGALKSGNLYANNSIIDVEGDLNINWGAFRQDTSDTIVSGNLAIATFGVFTKDPSESGTLKLDGATKSWSDAATARQDVGFLTIDGSISTTTDVKATEVTISDTKSLNISGDTLTISGSGEGASKPLTGTGTLTDDASTTVEFTGGAATTVNALTYGGSLKLNGTGPFNADGDIAINSSGTLTVQSGTFDASDNIITIYGNTVISGGTYKTGTNTNQFGTTSGNSVTISSGTLEIESDSTTSDINKFATWDNQGGTITYNAATVVEQPLLSSLSPYNNLTVNSSGSTYTANGHIVAASDVDIAAGTLAMSAYDLTVSGGDLDVAGAYTQVGNGTTTVKGDSGIGGTGLGGAGTTTIYDLVIGDATTSSDVILAGDVTVNNDVVVTTSAGTNELSLNQKNLIVKGGDITGNETIYCGNNTNDGCTTGTVTVDGTGSIDGGNDGYAFYNLTIGDGSAPAGTTTLVTGAYEFKNNLTIAANQEFILASVGNIIEGYVDVADGGALSLNGNALRIDGGTIKGAGTIYCEDAAHPDGCPSSTVTLNGTGDLNPNSGNFTFFNLDLGTHISGTTTLVLHGEDTLDVKNKLEIMETHIFKLEENLEISGDFEVTLDSFLWLNGKDFTINGGDLLGTGTIYCGNGDNDTPTAEPPGTCEGTVTLDGTGVLNSGNANPYTFWDLTLGDGSNYTTTTLIGGNYAVLNDLIIAQYQTFLLNVDDMTVANDVSISGTLLLSDLLTITNGDVDVTATGTLKLNEQDLTIPGGDLSVASGGRVWCGDGNDTCTAGKVTMKGTSATGIGGAGTTTFYNLDIGDTGDPSAIASAGDWTVKGMLTLEDSGSGTNTLDLNDDTISLAASSSGRFTINEDGAEAFDADTSTVKYTGDTTFTFITSTPAVSPYYNLELNSTDAGEVYILTGATTVESNLYVANGQLWLQAHELTVGTGNATGNIYGGGVITSSSVLTTLKGTGVIGGIQADTCSGVNGSYTFYDLTFGDGSNAKTTTICDEITTTNDLTIDANHELDGGSATTINIGNDYINTAGGTFTYNISTVNMTGDGAIQYNAGGKADFYNLTIDANKTVTLTSTTQSLYARVYNDLTVNGTLTSSANTENLTLFKDGDSPLILGASPGSVSGVNLVYYNPLGDTVATTVTGTTYKSLWLTCTTCGFTPTFTLGGATTVTSNLLIYGVDIDTVASLNTNDNTLDVQNIVGVGFATLPGVINLGASVADFDNNVSFSSDDQASLTMTSGTLNVEGNWDNPLDSDATFTAGSGTVIFDAGDTGNTIRMDGQSFNDVQFDNADGEWTLLDNAAAGGTVTVANGILEVDTHTLTVGVGVTVNGGTLSMTGSGGILEIADGGSFLMNNASGKVLTSDVETAPILTTSGTEGEHHFTVNFSDGELDVDEWEIHSVDTDGVQIGSSVTITNFNNITWGSDFETGGTDTLLNIAGQTENLVDHTFPASWSGGDCNVRASTSGVVDMWDWTGAYGGEENDCDNSGGEVVWKGGIGGNSGTLAGQNPGMY